MNRIIYPGVVAGLLALTLVACNGGRGGEEAPVGGSNPATQQGWLAVWGGTKTGGDAMNERTVRNIAVASVGGHRLRLRLFNEDAENSITIGRAFVGVRDQSKGDASLIAGSNRQVTFNGGQEGAVIAPGTESFYSDPIDMEVQAMDQLAVSFYVMGTDNAADQHVTTWYESWASTEGSGDFAAEEGADNFPAFIDGNTSQVPAGVPLVCNGCTTYALRDIELMTDEADGAIVLLGSSSLHGYNTTQGGFKRVGEPLSARMNTEIPARWRKSFVHRGIGGDRLDAALASRVDKDVFDTAGVFGVVVWVTNDLSSSSGAEVIASYREMIQRAHAAGLNVFCPTWVPGAQSSAANVSGERDLVNRWILAGNCDGEVDWGGRSEDPNNRNVWRVEHNSGDNIHGNDLAHADWALMTPLSDWVTLPRPAF